MYKEPKVHTGEYYWVEIGMDRYIDRYLFFNFMGILHQRVIDSLPGTSKMAILQGNLK